MAAFTGGTPSGGAETGGFNPAMFGDQLHGTSSSSNLRNGTAALIGRGSFKIADNDSPLPTDRVFINYNYFDRINNGAGEPTSNLNREVIGFEKTFLNGNASFEMRLPFLQLNNAPEGASSSSVGDITFVGKWAVINDRETGNVLSVGLAVTAATGDSLGDGIPHSTLIQPFMGYLINGDRFFVHGFSALVFSTEGSDSTLWLNDLGIGYWVYRDPNAGCLTGFVPTLEGHLLTPLTHQGAANGGIPDIFTFTGGLNAVFRGNSTLGCALAVPVTGPRPYDVEALVSFNLRF
jgi:hypothetical protein